jgi:uncharacterized sulfatase
MENSTNTNPPNAKPNIILITVDQMRFPMHLPPGTPTPEKFIAAYMPQLDKYIWSQGIRFSNYYTAASDCTAGRAALYTGLYAYQTYSMVTLITYPPAKPEQPVLSPDFPTIGKLMMDSGYDTPYYGKWHLSYDASDLSSYGFASGTPPQDYVGYPGQGLEVDPIIAREAAAWVVNRVKSGNTTPFFLPVNFVNPHDKQWYWGAMQGNRFNDVYTKNLPGETPPATAKGAYTEVPLENDPQSHGYSPNIRLATNWESEEELSHKPSTQTLIREVFQYQNGGIYEADKQATYTAVISPPGFYYANTDVHKGKHKAIAPDTALSPYWTEALDSYIQCMRFVDTQIGNFIEGLPSGIRENSIFVFTADHGEYASSHGLQGKGGTVYEEGIRVPLVVYDATHRYTGTPSTRNQLTSSVDVLPMIVSMGNNGTQSWMTDDYQQMYGNRCDLLAILANANAPGRQFALHTTDEFIPFEYNYLDAPLHVIGLIKMVGNVKQKLGVYTRWAPYTQGQPQATILNNALTQLEFYNHDTDANEMISTPDSPAAQAALADLFGGVPGILPLISSELQKPLPPGTYQDAQTDSYEALIEYMRLADLLASRPPSAEDKQEPEPHLLHAWSL